MRVRDIMAQPVVVADETATLQEVASMMLVRRIGGVPIVNAEGELVGIVTESDFVGTERSVPFAFPTTKLPQVFRRWMLPNTFEKILREVRECRVREIMVFPVVTADADESVQDIAERMIHERVSRVVVVRDRHPIGIVTHHDILWLVAGDWRRRPSGSLSATVSRAPNG
jgi:CBS domain-containing protein